MFISYGESFAVGKLEIVSTVVVKHFPKDKRLVLRAAYITIVIRVYDMSKDIAEGSLYSKL